MKYLNISSITLLIFCLFSCSKEDVNRLRSSSTVLEFEGEGGQEEISFNNSNWKITEVITSDNHRNIFGNVYSTDGDLIQENKILKLDSLGLLEASWPDKGFSIIRETGMSLNVKLNENFTKKDFDFIIVIESNNSTETKKINISQNPSQGYKFKSINYTIEENDDDSIFTEQGETYSFNINTSSTQQQMSFKPFANSSEISYFESPEEGAFPWEVTDSVMVKVPVNISDGKVSTNSDISPYTGEIITKNSKFKDKETPKITIPSGKSEFVVKIECRKRRVTYTMHLINNRTNKEKIISGKWVEIGPTGAYVLEWK